MREGARGRAGVRKRGEGTGGGGQQADAGKRSGAARSRWRGRRGGSRKEKGRGRSVGENEFVVERFVGGRTRARGADK